MMVLLKSPSEKACLQFEALLVGTFYCADDTEGSEDVCYTIEDVVLEERVRQWREQAIASGEIGDAVVLDHDQPEEEWA